MLTLEPWPNDFSSNKPLGILLVKWVDVVIYYGNTTMTIATKIAITMGQYKVPNPRNLESKIPLNTLLLELMPI